MKRYKDNAPGNSGSLRAFARAFLLTTAVAATMGTAAHADTLTDALVQAYETNPTLGAQRANLRATDEGVPQALSGWRPSLTAQGSYGLTNNRTETNGGIKADNTLHPLTGTVTLNQNIYAGGQTVNSTEQAKAAVQAGRATLSSVEQSVLLGAVQAYMNVIRDKGVLELNRNNVQVLKRELDATQDRFDVGELTRTDVSQAEARLSLSKTNLINAEAQLTASRAAYERVIGQAPGTLEEPARPSDLPQSETAAQEVARTQHPDVVAARKAEEASRASIRVAKGALLPSFDVQAKYQYARDPGNSIHDTEESAVLGVLTIPLYQSGSEYSAVRQAKQVNSQRRMEIAAAIRAVDEAVRNAWEQLRASQSAVLSTTEQVKANKIALDGVRQEAQVGSRTTLDVLNAEQELLNSRVTLVSAERDRSVAEYGLLAAMGQLTAKKLALPVKYYDPQKNYDEVRGKWIGFGTGDEE